MIPIGGSTARRGAAARRAAALLAGFGAVLPGPALAADVAGPISAGRLLQVGLGLLVVLALIGASAFAVRRLLRIEPTGSGPLRVVAGLSMGPRERVLLVDAAGCRLLIGVAPGRIQTLHVIGEAPATPVTEAPAPGGFRAVLAAARRGGREHG